MPKLASEEPTRLVPRGFQAVEFVCPRCSSKRWGTFTPIFHGVWGEPTGQCQGLACSFTWLRELDWLWFRTLTGERFTSLEAFNEAIGGLFGPGGRS